MNDLEIKNVRSIVRPHRAAILVNSNAKGWKTYVHSLITAFSKSWGGEYFLIIPTDGKTIHHKFWQILESYSPDVIGRYIPTFKDLELIDFEAYQRAKQHWQSQWEELSGNKDFDLEEKWEEAAKTNELNLEEFEIDTELQTELINRLSPFHHEEHVVTENVFGNQPLGYPFTNVYEINETAKKPLNTITLPWKMQDEDLNLLAIARTGNLTTSEFDDLQKSGLKLLKFPDTIRDNRYIETLESKDTKQGFPNYLLFLGSETKDQEEYLINLPFQNSMLNLSNYYRTDIHKEHEEDFQVIIGDNIVDYCLFYCLSRIHPGIHWLPDSLLHEAHTKHREASKGSGDKFSITEQAAAQLVNTYFKNTSHGHSAQKINLISSTLTKRQLQIRKRWMTDLCFVDPAGFERVTKVASLEDVNINCVFRVMERDNFFQQQDLIFQNGKSLGKVQTPKPKNFTDIDQNKHRWITQLGITGYQLPPLPYLAAETFIDLVAGYDCRIAVDGMAYFCPNAILFGGDVDTNLVKPSIKVLSSREFFTKYFENMGYKTELSDKGSYLENTIEKFGSLELTANFFKVAQNIKVFNKYMLDKKAILDEDKEGIIVLDVDHRNYLSYDVFKKEYLTDEITELVLDSLVNSKILHRGYIFQCEYCRRTDWYGIETISRTFTCKRCERVQQYSFKNWKWSPEPKWYYHLDEIVYQFYRSNSYVTALALDNIRNASKESFMFISESNIIDKENNKKEIDIIALSDGKIILGECKSGKTKQNELTKYLHLYKNFKFRPNEFIFATTEAKVSDEISAIISKIANSKILLSSDLYRLSK